MSFVNDNCSFYSLREGLELAAEPFSCGDKDLDDFFREDFIPFEDNLFGKSYCFVTDDAPHRIVAAFTVCNGSIHNRMLTSGAKKQITKEMAEEKRNINYPAVLIGRLGVSTKEQGNNIGTDVMDFIKNWFVDPDNKTGCRFLLVDAYNNPRTLNYYTRNGFEYLISNLESEKRYRRMESIEGELHTRLMRFDLIQVKRPKA